MSSDKSMFSAVRSHHCLPRSPHPSACPPVVSECPCGSIPHQHLVMPVFWVWAILKLALRWWLSRKESTCNAGDAGSIPGSGRCPGERNGNPLQCSCLGNPMDRGAYSPWGCKELDITKRLNHHHQSWVVVPYHCFNLLFSDDK